MRPASFRATVLALGIGQLLGWAFLYFAFTSFVLPMRQAFGWREPEVMGAFTLGLACWGIASYLVGAQVDRGRGRAVMSWGAVIGGAGFLVWAQAHSLAAVYVAWALIGVSMAALLYEPAFGILAKRFPDRYRGAIATLTLFGGFGSTLSFTTVTWLIAQLEWRLALVVIGATLMVVVAPLHAWALRGPQASAPPQGGSIAPEAVPGTTLREAVRGASFWLLTLAFTLYAFAAAGIWAHMMPALSAKGQAPAQALTVVFWFGPAQVLGRFLYLLASRRMPAHVSARGQGVAVLGALAASLAVFALADRTWALLVFAVAFGVANGLVTIVRGAIVPEYFGRAHVGRINGAMSAISLVVRASAPVVTAWVLVLFADYGRMLLLLSGACLLAALAIALSRSGAAARCP